MSRRIWQILPALVVLIIVLTGCSAGAPDELTPVTLMLDWVPNTNHTGIYVAQAEGYFTEAGLDVTIIEPGEVFAEQAVATGLADFGFSFQEYVTIARASQETPIVSIAAVIQHNTSGFAARSSDSVTSAAGWEGLTYGSFGSPFEQPTLRGLMDCAGADYGQLTVVDTGYADPLALLNEEQIDLAWIFYGWQGIQAEQQGIALDTLMMEAYSDCIPDYYTPVLITSEAMITDDPETVAAFVEAVSRGYQFSIDNPGDAASALLEAVPELDEELVRESLSWLAPRYQDDAARWGEQQASVWENFAAWMLENGIIEQPLDASAAFTNDFLP